MSCYNHMILSTYHMNCHSNSFLFSLGTELIMQTPSYEISRFFIPEAKILASLSNLMSSKADLRKALESHNIITIEWGLLLLSALFIHLCQINIKVIQFLNFAVNLSLDDKLSRSLHTLTNHQIKKTMHWIFWLHDM